MLKNVFYDMNKKFVACGFVDLFNKQKQSFLNWFQCTSNKCLSVHDQIMRFFPEVPNIHNLLCCMLFIKVQELSFIAILCE